MDIIHSDTYVSLSPEQHPNYNDSNPLLKLMSLIETMQLSEKRQYYPAEDLQYLVPIEHLDIYGPSGSDYQILDPMQQDNKLDFQKQNIKDFITTDTFLIRGIVSLDNWTGPFIRISYRGGPDSQLSQLASQNGETLGDHIKMWIKIGNDATNDLVIVPYNPINNRYEIELWGYNKLDSNIKDKLSDKGKKSIESGELQIRPDLIHGSMDDFKREVLDDKDVSLISPDNVMHPILPLHIEVAWTDNSSKYWDSKHGDNYQYEFNMKVRGWKNFIGIGNSSNPHGGIGFLEYRNLFSNYGKYSHLMDLSRKLESWNFNAFGNKNHANNPENFFVVDYVDLHIVKENSGIGLHRHRDNQEIFFLMEGRVFMIVGDWCKNTQRERCLEIRTLKKGHLAMLKGGNLHGLMNPYDVNLPLLMFGGYD